MDAVLSIYNRYQIRGKDGNSPIMDPSTITSEQAKKLLDAQAHIWNYIFSFLNSMALKCALELGIPDAIQTHGKPMTLTELSNSIPIHPAKAPSLHRLMRLLCHSNFFSKTKLDTGEPAFGLTINSQLLLKDHPLTLASFALAMLEPNKVDPAHHLSRWFESDVLSPFNIAHGRSIWEHASLVPEFNECFNEAMASDTRFVASLVVANDESKGLFEGVESLVDVGGGNGTMAKAIAKAYPGLKCVVFDLPHVVEGLENAENLVYVGGDMFEAIPPADAVLLKWILHDWTDEHCVKILKRCKEAIPDKEQGGKVIVIDMVMENQNDVMKHFNSQILWDMQMMSATIGGKERTEEEWKTLFIQAGFNDYKLFPIVGARSIIEAYPS